MSRGANREKLIQFLETIRRPDVPVDTIADEDSLVKSGLIDSLATLEIITFLESEFNIDFSISGVNPNELESIATILKLIDRHTLS